MDKNVPKRRFKEFNEQWNQVSLDEILNYEQPDKYIVKNDNYSDNYKTPVLTAGQSLLLGHTNEINNIKKGSQNPVIIFDDFTTSSHYINYDFKIKSSAMKLLNSKPNSDLYFSSLLLKNVKYEVMNHGRHWISIYSNINVKSPKYKEQKQIGEFFQKLDNMIELQSKKVNKYEMLKESYLEKLYIRSKNKKPDLYFDQFSNNLIYENGIIDSYIDKITDFVAAGSFAAMAENVKYLSKPSFAQLVRTTDLKNNFKNNGFVYVNEHAFNFLSHVNLDKKTIVLPNVGNCGEVYLSDPKKLPYKRNVLGPNSIYVYTDKLDLEYLYYYFNTKTFQKKLKLIISPSGQSKFNKTDFKNIDIRVSANLEEQKVIGCFFSKLDNIIELQNEKLDKLKNLKKAYLNEVFVN